MTPSLASNSPLPRATPLSAMYLPQTSTVSGGASMFPGLFFRFSPTVWATRADSPQNSAHAPVSTASPA